MKQYLLNALKKVPTAIMTTAKENITYGLAATPLKATANIKSTINKEIDNNILEIKNAPQQLLNEFQRISTHTTGQPFNSNQYFHDYYQQQQQRYNPTPQPNFAEVIHNMDQQKHIAHMDKYRLI